MCDGVHMFVLLDIAIEVVCTFLVDDSTKQNREEATSAKDFGEYLFAA